MVNTEELRFRRKYEEMGYAVVHTGIPDFILLKNGTISFVEVKSKGDQLTPHQKQVIKLLKKHKFKVEVKGEGAPHPRAKKIEKRRYGEKMVRKYVCLSQREQEVMELLLELNHHGLAARYIVGSRLNITESAVNSCLSRVRKKLDDALVARRRYREVLKRRR